MAVHDNLRNEYNNYKNTYHFDHNNIYNQACFAHFYGKWKEWQEHEYYICGFSTLATKKELRGVTRFVSELSKLFPNAKRVGRNRLTGIVYKKGSQNKQFYFKINPKEWQSYPTFMLLFGSLRLIEEYPSTVREWIKVDKAVGNKLDFFQKFTIAHIIDRGCPYGHNVFDGYYVKSGNQTLDNLTWPLLKEKIDNDSWEHNKSVVGFNCSLVPKNYIQRMSEPFTQFYNQEKFDFEEFKKCMDQLHIKKTTSVKAVSLPATKTYKGPLAVKIQAPPVPMNGPGF